MAQFASGFIRPGVYVRQIAGQGAAQLPPTFIAALIGHGTDRFAVVDKEIVSSASTTDVLDAERNGVSIVGIKVNNIAVSASNYALVNSGSLPFGSASVTWSTGKPAAGVSYYVSYVAYKNPGVDFEPLQLNDDMANQLSYYGAPAISASEVLNGVYVQNNLSIGAYIGNVQGAKSWYSCQLNSFDTSTLGATMAAGKIVGATGATGTTFSINLNGDGAQTVTITAGLTGTALAAAVQSGVQGLVAANSALQAAYDQFTCGYTGSALTLTSGMVGSTSAVVISGAITGGTPTAGSGPTLLDLTDEPGLATATTQILTQLELLDCYVIVPLFPVVSGGINDSIVSLIEAHVTSMRELVTQKWRVALMGAQKNTDTGTNPEAKYIAAAAALGTNALAYVAPATAKFIYGGIEFVLDGYGIAAAVAGIMTNPNYGPGEPISGKPLVGFSEIKDKFNTTQKNLMGNAGILMIDSEMGSPAIIMDLTTDQSNAVNSQLKFTRAADYVSKSLRLILRRLYINTNNLGTGTMANIGTSVKMILQQLAWLNIINDFSDPVVSRNETDPRQVDLTVSIQLVPDVSWIYISLGVNL